MDTALKPREFDDTVLYVDDEEMARKYFGHSVGAQYEVLTAPDADAAIALLQDESRQIGILVTDYRMPGRDGGDLLRQVAREFPHVVRIVVTAYADREVLLDTVNSGEVFRILEKPIHVGQLLEALRQASGMSRVRNARRQRLMAMDETLAFLAHELNTPLASIVNFAQGVRSRVGAGVLSPQQQAEIGRAARSMDDNARYCLSLLSSFAESLRRTGVLSEEAAGGSARNMVHALLDAYPLTPAQRAAIKVEVREDFPIEALPDCVTLVLSSILGNALRAVQAQPDAVVRFTVAAEERPRISIADNGPGIPPSIMARLLNDPVTTRKDADGKGWGLIFCKRIMQSFGGAIQIDSVPGEHTEVTLIFPAARIRRSDI